MAQRGIRYPDNARNCPRAASGLMKALFDGLAPVQFAVGPILMVAVLFSGCKEERMLESILPVSGTAPRIIAAYPPDGQKGLQGKALWVLFNQPMDRSQCERAFSITGPRGDIQGAFSWKGDIRMEFLPRGELEAGKHLMRVATSAEGKDGLDLREEYRSHFYPSRDHKQPSFLNSEPSDGSQGVSENADLRLHFSEAVTMGSLRNGIRTSPTFRFSLERENQGATAVVQPIDSLIQGQTYDVTVKDTIQDSDGNHLANPDEISFRVGSDFEIPEVLSVSAGERTLPEGLTTSGVSKHDSLTIQFSEPMARDVTESAISLSPASLSRKSWSHPDQLTLEPEAPLQSQIQYRLTIANDIQDLAGNRIIDAEEYPFITDASDSRPPAVEVLQQVAVDLPGGIDGAQPVSDYFPDPELPDYGIVDTAHQADLNDEPGLSRALVFRILFSRDMSLTSLYESLTFIPIIDAGGSDLEVHTIRFLQNQNEVLVLASWTPAGSESSPVFALEISTEAADTDGNHLESQFRRFLSF
ncbi:MAG: hypothetical protein CMF59_15875 [Leptospiraceae bacterium]|nr:hypothetical protein [Leptospiraceae bacterium]